MGDELRKDPLLRSPKRKVCRTRRENAENQNNATFMVKTAEPVSNRRKARKELKNKPITSNLLTAKNMKEESSKDTLVKNTQENTNRKRGRPRKQPCIKETAENQENATNVVNTAKSVSNKRKPANKPKNKLVIEHYLNCIPTACSQKPQKELQSNVTGKIELTKASKNILKKPLFITSTPKKVKSAFIPISQTLNLRLTRASLPPRNLLNQTSFDTKVRNKTGSKIADPSTLHTIQSSKDFDFINKNPKNQIFDRTLKIVLEDSQAKVFQGQRRRSKSLCLYKNTRHAETVESLSSFGKHKKLKVVLEDIQCSKNKLRRRSKSLCVKLVNIADLISRETKLNYKTQVTSGKVVSKPITSKSKGLITTKNSDKCCNINQQATKCDSEMFSKELVIKLQRVNKRKASRKTCGVQQVKQLRCEKRRENNKGQTSINNQEIINESELAIQLIPLKNLNFQKKEATFKVPTVAPKSKRKLRKLEPKRYLEESDTEFLADSPALNLSLKKKDYLPVYRKVLPESPKKDCAVTDLYEFTDLSPKKPKVVKQKKHRESSILFDRDTYEIVNKIELNEAKARKRAAKKDLILHMKTYKNIVSDIVKNLGIKINNKIQLEDVIHKEKVKKKVQQDNNANKLPLLSLHKNELENDMDLITQSPPDLPSRDHSPEPSISIIEPKSSHATIQKPLTTPLSINSSHEKSVNVSQSTPILVALSSNVTTKRGINGPCELVVLRSIHGSDNSFSQQDIDTFFGFEEEYDLPNSSCINHVKNINVKRGGAQIDSPANFHVRRPNANSTMCQRTSSPWRPNLNVWSIPHFVSIKNNALPRINQDMVMDHTLVKNFENSSKIEHNNPGKRPPQQTSILEYVQEKENTLGNTLMQRSLYDVEEFDSPDKINRRRRNGKANKIRRNLQVSITGSIIGDASKISPQKRTPLMPLNESQQGCHHPNTATEVAESITYFGFDESGLIEDQENQDENSPGKPFRFNLTNLKRYYKKQKRAKQKSFNKKEYSAVPEVLNNTPNKESISVMDGFSEDANDEDYLRLFEEPEEICDKMAMDVQKTKPKRRRRDSCDSDTSEHGKKKRKHKKTKFELEQEAWIKNFNEICADIDKERLEVE